MSVHVIYLLGESVEFQGGFGPLFCFKSGTYSHELDERCINYAIARRKQVAPDSAEIEIPGRNTLPSGRDSSGANRTQHCQTSLKYLRFASMSPSDSSSPSSRWL